jgi:hypothetical protein
MPALPPFFFVFRLRAVRCGAGDPADTGWGGWLRACVRACRRRRSALGGGLGGARRAAGALRQVRGTASLVRPSSVDSSRLGCGLDSARTMQHCDLCGN